uniref:Proteasome subunit beta n=1 Tax=Aceria tosichella TaxID=561515 RepID=A0A6G1SIM8_9ACAR
MSIMAYNGGCVVAMKGKDCVAIASDKRFGVQGRTMSSKFQRVFQFGPRLFVGLPGLATDTLTVYKRLKFRTNMYELRENRKMRPRTLAAMISSFLYEKRFGPYFIEPIIAGIDDKTGEPFIGCMDLIGCLEDPEDFCVAGTCDQQLYGMCETLWEPNLNPDELFEVIAQALVNACDRDAISGWGATVHIITKDSVTVKEVKMRMD